MVILYYSDYVWLLCFIFHYSLFTILVSVQLNNYYIRLSALHRGGAFSPNASLRSTLGWIHPPFQGFYSGRRGWGRTHGFAPTLTTFDYTDYLFHFSLFTFHFFSQRSAQQLLHQAFSPPDGIRPFSPTLRFAPHWAEIMRPCGAFTAVSQQLNDSTNKHLNNSTPAGEYKGWKPALFQPHPVRVGDRRPIPCLKGWKPELIGSSQSSTSSVINCQWLFFTIWLPLTTLLYFSLFTFHYSLFVHLRWFAPFAPFAFWTSSFVIRHS